MIDKSRFNGGQLFQINEGLDHGLSESKVEIYAKEEYNWEQMRIIRIGLEEGLSLLDIKLYANKCYSHKQMFQIFLGLIQGVNVYEYTFTSLSVSKMREIRESLLREKNNTKNNKKTKKIIITFDNGDKECIYADEIKPNTNHITFINNDDESSYIYTYGNIAKIEYYNK